MENFNSKMFELNKHVYIDINKQPHKHAHK